MYLINFLHHINHQYAYLPLILFVVALLSVIAAFSTPKTQMRYLGYAVAVVLICCFAFII